MCKAVEKSAAELNAMVMDMSELSQDLSFRAIGKFKHSGVAAHPSDKGHEKNCGYNISEFDKGAVT